MDLPSLLVPACYSHPSTWDAFSFFPEAARGQELGFLKCKQMEASRSVEAIRGFLPPSSTGLLSLVCGCSCSFLFSIWVLSACQLFFFSQAVCFAAGCRRMQDGVTWLLIVWNQTFHTEVWIMHGAFTYITISFGLGRNSDWNDGYAHPAGVFLCLCAFLLVMHKGEGSRLKIEVCCFVFSF